MKRWIMLTVAAMGLLAVAGCLEMDQQITVRPDGSGEIHRKLLFGQQMVQMLSMGEQPGEGEGEAAPANPEGVAPAIAEQASEEALKAEATKLGEGVTLKSRKLLKTKEGKQGFEATYAFTDARKFTGEILSMEMGARKDDSEDGKEDKAVPPFAFTPAKANQPAKLVIQMPKDEDEDEDKTPPNREQVEQMAPMFSDMNVVMAVTVEGKITKTDAKYVNGSTVTLVKMDLAGLSKDPKFKNKLVDVLMSMNTRKKTLEFLSRDDMAGVDKYIKVEPKEAVTIEFTK